MQAFSYKHVILTIILASGITLNTQAMHKKMELPTLDFSAKVGKENIETIRKEMLKLTEELSKEKITKKIKKLIINNKNFPKNQLILKNVDQEKLKEIDKYLTQHIQAQIDLNKIEKNPYNNIEVEFLFSIASICLGVLYYKQLKNTSSDYTQIFGKAWNAREQNPCIATIIMIAAVALMPYFVILGDEFPLKIIGGIILAGALLLIKNKILFDPKRKPMKKLLKKLKVEFLELEEKPTEKEDYVEYDIPFDGKGTTDKVSYYGKDIKF